MSAAHLISLASLMIDVMMLGQVLPARTSETDVAMPAASGGLSSYSRDELPAAFSVDRLSGQLAYLLLAAAEEPVQATSDPVESRVKSETPIVEQKAPVKAAETHLRKPNIVAQAREQPIASSENVAPGESASGKPTSIIKMLEGHERELLAAVMIAAAFFSIGWICGGNYYLRRDRRRRSKLRF